MKRIRFGLTGLGLAVALAACGTSAAQPPASGGADPATADVTITSVDMAFVEETMTVRAGEAFTIALVNEDTMPHNVAIYTDSSASEELFIGDMVTDGTIVYEIPALEAGEYFFRCDLHPDMVGTLIVEG